MVSRCGEVFDATDDSDVSTVDIVGPGDRRRFDTEDGSSVELGIEAQAFDEQGGVSQVELRIGEMRVEGSTLLSRT